LEGTREGRREGVGVRSDTGVRGGKGVLLSGTRRGEGKRGAVGV